MMPSFILHKDGAYNIYTTVANGAYYESALTLEQLETVIEREFGQDGVARLPGRLRRAHATGCSSRDGTTLHECIEANRAGPNESSLASDEFIARYLTLETVGASSGAKSEETPEKS